jgi:hypothetical protein
MKRFKELRNELISEAEFDPYGLNAKSVLTDDGVHRLENPGNIARINQFIDNFLEGECMNVKVKLEQLRVRLNHIGLDFNVNEGLSDDDITSYPVNYYGKAYGYHPETNEIGEYDNATAKFGRPLVFSVRKSGEGSYYLEGKIHFVGEEGIEEEEDELYGESLELRLNIDNDDELFESKIIPALESADDEERAYRGLVYAVRSAAKKYEMDVSDDDIHSVAESIFAELMDVEEEVEELDELKMPKTNKRAKGVSAALSRPEEASIKVGDTVHLGHGTKGGTGVIGKVTKVSGGMVYIQNDKGDTFRAPISRASLMEDVQLDEISSDTLRSYVSKASGQVRSDLSTGRGAYGNHTPKTNKRARGVSKAKAELDIRKMLGIKDHFEHEDVEEAIKYNLGRNTTGEVTGKGKRDRGPNAQVGVQYKYKGKPDGNLPIKPKDMAKHLKAARQGKSDETLITNVRLQKDHVELEGDDLQELKSSTLRSYLDKARDDNQKRVIRMADRGTAPTDPDEMRKLKKRRRGSEAAVSRLDARKQLKGAPKGSQRHSEWGKLAKDDK